MYSKKPVNHLRLIFITCSLLVISVALYTQRAHTTPTEEPAAESPSLPVENEKSGRELTITEKLIEGGRSEVKRMPIYRSAYYVGGYPPESEGVCTDLIWRAFKHIDYDLKAMIDKDIKHNTNLYPRTNGKPDPHIDFRRVPNQLVFFKRHAESLIETIDPADPENLAQWRPGDIVVFKEPDHIAILSDKRNAQGIPYLIHNSGPVAMEADFFMFWYNKGLTGHFRFPKEN